LIVIPDIFPAISTVPITEWVVDTQTYKSHVLIALPRYYSECQAKYIGQPDQDLVSRNDPKHVNK
jgi:hypothetical protein